MSQVTHWRPYPKYKVSSVEWLGEIPSHWDIWKVSHAFRQIGSGTTPPSTQYEYYDNGTVPWVTTSELREKTIFDTEKKVTISALTDFPILTVFPKGTLLIAMYGATIGRLGILGVEACTNQACCALAGAKNLDTRFTFHWLVGFREHIIRLSSGGGQPNINQEKVRSLRIAAPPLPEQHAIADFLDRETAKLDTLIAKKQRLIELLGEKRAALISQAVTRGLNPEAPMKDSGVEWLGEIPAHWEMDLVKRHFKIDLGKMLDSSKQPEDGELKPYLRAANIYWEGVWLDDVNEMKFTKQQLKRYRLQKGDLLVTEGGVTVGRSAIWHGELGECYYQNSINRARPKGTVPTKFLYYWLYALKLDGYIDILADKATFGHLTKDKLVALLMTVPPMTEAQQIVEFLDGQLAQIERLEAKIRSAIECLQEYRTALISAAVTGKIDVRGAVKGQANSFILDDPKQTDNITTAVRGV